MPASAIQPGFIALHSHRAEVLADTLTGWLRAHPLHPLESEVVLVQSNGMAEWIKIELARQTGVCAATRVELPSRFLWRTYRQVLGPQQVPPDSPLDKLPMTWRLMALLPDCLHDPVFQPVAGFLRGDEPDRLLQLASRLADLFDQYQIYRPDWLEDWAAGRNVLRKAAGQEPLADDQCWQAELWRCVLASLDKDEHGATRPALHARALAHLRAGQPLASPVARRVSVFGMSHMPGQLLEMLAAMAAHSQVLLAVPNPCRYHWSDIIDGREWLQVERRRHAYRGEALAKLPLAQMHLHAPTLLAAWGRQGRDFIRQLDAFDDLQAAQQLTQWPRLDFFEDVPGEDPARMLTQLQRRIRDLEPSSGGSKPLTLTAGDRSLMFSVAHSPVRELEVLHDQLLCWFHSPPGGQPLSPRNVVVMVPDIERMAPAIRAVFGQYKRNDARFIPFDIADLGAQANSPLIHAVEWLLALPQQRSRMSELIELLEVPALAARFGLSEQGLPILTRWMAGSGIRWGLSGAHRAGLGLGVCGEDNSALFGVQRMLLGYACGADPLPANAAGLTPYAEVGGLDAELAGSLAHLLQTLIDWWQTCSQSLTPTQWAERGRVMLAALFKPQDDHDRNALAALEQALTDWVRACDDARFDDAVPLAVARSAWLEALKLPRLEQRFRAGGVTFCTLMPMRAIPFKAVCLLGMNDGDYPRRSPRADFDLMGQPGMARPGDRSRRDDDRQLMLEALLSARQVLYVSWSGRSVRDNSEQPPSVLVSQLRDEIDLLWGPGTAGRLTTVHPLQPFSRVYFEEGSPLQTYAREWRAAQETRRGEVAVPAEEAGSSFEASPWRAGAATPRRSPVLLPPLDAALGLPTLSLNQLARFLRKPVAVFFRERLQVNLEAERSELHDEERFGLDGLDLYQLLDHELQHVPADLGPAQLLPHAQQVVQRLRQAGALPLAGVGTLEARKLVHMLQTQLAVALREREACIDTAVRVLVLVDLAHPQVALHDVLGDVRTGETGPLRLTLSASKLVSVSQAGKATALPEKLIDLWLQSLAAAAMDQPLRCVAVGRNALVRLPPSHPQDARAQLRVLLDTWVEGMRWPLPLPPGVALQWLKDSDNLNALADAYEGSDFRRAEKDHDPALARTYPTLGDLLATDALGRLAKAVYAPLCEWAEQADIELLPDAGADDAQEDAGMSAHALDAHSFPLRGSHLIEASAGTGKTWTIAAIYVRLVLGHGGAGTAPVRPLLPQDVLVMTFTRAATRELSDRIRARLTEAAQVFRGLAETRDAFLLQLRDEYPEGEPREQAAYRLALAAQAMDDAAVYTIDAWCQRMLREHAFDSGNLFEERLVGDEAALRLEAVQDYWRQQLYPMATPLLAQVLGIWRDVPALEKDMRDLMAVPLPEAAPGTLAQVFATALAEREAQLAALKQGWDEKADQLLGWIEAQLAVKKHGWNGSLLQVGRSKTWLTALKEWARSDGHFDALKEAMGKGWARFTPEGLLECRKEGDAVEWPPESHAYAELLTGLAALPDPAYAARLHARTHVLERMAELKRRSGQFGFSDMLQRLDVALADPESGERLAQRLRAQFPVAMIDEFQDTSPLQFRIFDRIYRTADNRQDAALLLIGDPKQSIYGFRGADIHSYLTARRATAGRHHVLGTNYRSTRAMVDVVNRWFQLTPGAFGYRRDDDDPLPFQPVAAKGREEVFRTRDGEVQALTVVHDATLRSARDALTHLSALCAEQIVAWLSDPQARFANTQRGDQALQPRDIAVLVRTGKEAAAVREALRARGVASVYLSDRDSVFASDEAQDLCRWLRGVAEPQDTRRVRAALGTRTVGLSLAELHALATDDERLDQCVEQMRELQQTWQSQGVLAMLRQSLHVLELAGRWRGQLDGERRLTNVLHLAELLQTASSQLDGEQALIRWLARQIEQAHSGSAADSEEQTVRLESDEDLVKVITIHASKGLEYPVVCLPFAHSHRVVEAHRAAVLNLDDGQGERRWTLAFDRNNAKGVDRDRLREDLRLWYVALTRAQHALWVGWSAVKTGNSDKCRNHLSAPGHLLGGGQEFEAADWRVRLQALQTTVDGKDLSVQLELAASQAPVTFWQKPARTTELRDALTCTARIDKSWTIASFSRLARDLSSQSLAHKGLDMAAPRPADDEPAADEVTPSVQAVPQAAWHGFAKGPTAGNFLHDQLEWLAAEGFVLDELRVQRLRQRCDRAGHAVQADVVVQWLSRIVSQPLQGPEAPLHALNTLLPEMEFWLPAGRLHAREVDALCRQHLLPGVDRPRLPDAQLHGMLMGFADLVFEHQDRYWVLDYKSNHLGNDGAAYTPQALAQAMAHHRYEVQAALYMLALHRLLRARLGKAYDPAQQLGGAVYFFLRGIDGPAAGCCTLPAPLDLIDGLDAMLSAEEK